MCIMYASNVYDFKMLSLSMCDMGILAHLRFCAQGDFDIQSFTALVRWCMEQICSQHLNDYYSSLSTL